MYVGDLISQWLSYPAPYDRILSMIGIEIHWAILQYVIGLSFLAFVAEVLYLYTKRRRWLRIAKTLAKGFIIVFAVGAATGTASEFGLILLWPNLTEAAGRYIYFPLYAEVFAFLMEITFIYMMWYAWDRLSPKAHVAVTLLAFVGAWYSAAMILSVNSYMVSPTGVYTAYDPHKGWKYGQEYPKVLLYIPSDIAGKLNVTTLRGMGVEVVAQSSGSTAALIPSRIVQRLVYEAWRNVEVKDSILKGALKREYASDTGLLHTPVKVLVDGILVDTIRRLGVYTVTFQSPVYPATVAHVIGSALVVSSFTVMAGYGLRLAKLGGERGKYSEYVYTGFRFGAVLALVFIAVQGLVFGHIMGVAVANHNPEEFAAMEGTSTSITSISEVTGARALMPLIAYGDPNARLPVYDQIPEDYCQLASAQNPAIPTCRPPLLIHYMYYTKVGLGILLGLYALLMVFYIWRRGVAPEAIVKIGVLSPVIAHIISFLGWGVRELGRKPWTIYGVMTVDVAHTANPPTIGTVALVALFLVSVVSALFYAVWKILWVHGGE